MSDTRLGLNSHWKRKRTYLAFVSARHSALVQEREAYIIREEKCKVKSPNSCLIPNPFLNSTPTLLCNATSKWSVNGRASFESLNGGWPSSTRGAATIASRRSQHQNSPWIMLSRLLEREKARKVMWCQPAKYAIEERSWRPPLKRFSTSYSNFSGFPNYRRIMAIQRHRFSKLAMDPAT